MMATTTSKRNFSSDDDDDNEPQAAGLVKRPKLKHAAAAVENCTGPNKNKHITGSATGAGSETGNNWDSMLEQLTKFKEQHGHCNPPMQSSEHPDLGAWVAKQRDLYKTTEEEEKLSDEQVAKLNEIGFDWQPRNPRHLQWETRFSQLQDFKKKYGHVQVPIGWSENVQLANWVSKQRQEYKNLLRGRTTRLDENRIRLLNSVGFAWQLQRGGRRRQLKARKKTASGDHNGSDHSSDGGVGGGKDGADDDDADDGPCILPGEVLIGQGAATPMSPENRGPDGVLGSKGGKKGRAGSVAKDIRSSNVQGPAPSPLQQPFTQNMHSSLLASSAAMGGMALPGMMMPGAVGAGQQCPPNNNDLLDLVLARNALFTNLQRPQAAPTSLQMFGAAGGYPGLSFQGFQGFQQVAAANQHAHLLAAAQQANRNPLFQPSMFAFGAGGPVAPNQFSNAGPNFGPQASTGGGGNNWLNGNPESAEVNITTSIQRSQGVGIRGMEESKATGGGEGMGGGYYEQAMHHQGLLPNFGGRPGSRSDPPEGGSGGYQG